jgi:hypothetical protein
MKIKYVLFRKPYTMPLELPPELQKWKSRRLHCKMKAPAPFWTG